MKKAETDISQDLREQFSKYFCLNIINNTNLEANLHTQR